MTFTAQNNAQAREKNQPQRSKKENVKTDKQVGSNFKFLYKIFLAQCFQMVLDDLHYRLTCNYVFA